jgi:hypothetical protein
MAGQQTEKAVTAAFSDIGGIGAKSSCLWQRDKEGSSRPRAAIMRKAPGSAAAEDPKKEVPPPYCLLNQGIGL